MPKTHKATIDRPNLFFVWLRPSRFLYERLWELAYTSLTEENKTVKNTVQYKS